MDKSVAGFFLPIAVHIIGCIINFRNLLWGHPTWMNVLVSTCCILFGFLFPLFARRWPFAVTVTAVLAGFLLLSCLLLQNGRLQRGAALVQPFTKLRKFPFAAQQTSCAVLRAAARHGPAGVHNVAL